MIGPAKIGHVGPQNLTTFQTLAIITLYSNMVQSQKFQSLLIIYLALEHCLQNPNTKFQHWDMSHQMALYILAHMPYFRRPMYICMEVLDYCYACMYGGFTLLLFEHFSYITIANNKNNLRFLFLNYFRWYVYTFKQCTTAS